LNSARRGSPRLKLPLNQEREATAVSFSAIPIVALPIAIAGFEVFDDALKRL
jgi:hypothetical protein